ncbi:mannose-6-phosphate isomerase, class I [Cryptococcus amylolentus CBS 6273]|uniref:Mannose-6-phosphate isomerase n=1 Tax=Cryptococcus amylolentus CBS 6273 TaxID=1296118 RepID=A0A1E3K3S9_9TREE|nr:mannose-6-phosphate isomerase, class I [Cryptococcus amylolentus CBS 6273]
MSSSQSSRIHRLTCVPNDYPWGEVGNDSLAARLTKNASKSFNVKPDQPYAELWMGTHPNNPAHLYSSPETLLSSYLNDHPELLGSVKNFETPFTGAKGSGTEGQEEGHVSFLFKVLTCKQALPLQIHPNKDLAQKLHKDNPEQFGDVNHKPEIAVCLSDRFLGFASFRPYAKIVSLLRNVPEVAQLSTSLRSAVDAFISSPSGKTLQKTWGEFLKLGDSEEAIKVFSQRVLDQGPSAFSGVNIEDDDKKRLVRAVELGNKYNPGDGGLFSSLQVSNCLELKKGQGMYVGADGPHAWMEGEIVELMAISDNVINVGFTGDDAKDDPSLVAEIVTCTPKAIEDLILDSQTFSKGKKGNTTVYSVPFEEFSIMKIDGDEVLEALDGAGIAVVIDGEYTLEEEEGVKHGGQGPDGEGGQGTVWFIGSHTETKWTARDGKGEVWIAFYDKKAPHDEVGPK